MKESKGQSEPRVLPRLLYVGDVPVEASYHGSALLHRLLHSYPADRLRVVEGNFNVSLPSRRLRNVQYQVLHVGSRRLKNSRVHAWYSTWLSLKSSARAARLERLVNGFEPEAVLTVAHGHAWLTASEYARRRGIPLHLVVHDDWPRCERLPSPFSGLVDRQLGHVYGAASSRLCVSPFMIEEYARRYGVEGSLLYPSRASDVETFAAPPERLRQPKRGIVAAFAGNLFAGDYLELLRALAGKLEALGGRVLVFGPLTDAQSAEIRRDMTAVQICGLVSSAELIARLRAEADVLFVPMSFEDTHRANVEINFPSKLTDYTSVGLPLLIWGPESSSVVRWARDNPGVAEIVATREEAGLAAALARLAENPEHRFRLGAQALDTGTRMFSHSTAWSVLTGALAGRARQ